MADIDDRMSGFGRSSRKAQSFVDKAKGGASTLDEVNFGGASSYRRKEEERGEINKMMHEQRGHDRQRRLLYKKAVRAGDYGVAAGLAKEGYDARVGTGARRAGDDMVSAGMQVSQREQAIEKANLQRGEPNADQVALAEDFAKRKIDIGTDKGKSRMHQLFKDNPMATTAHEMRKLLKDLSRDPNFEIPKAKRVRDPFSGKKGKGWDFGQGPKAAPVEEEGGKGKKGKKKKGEDEGEDEDEPKAPGVPPTVVGSSEGEGGPSSKGTSGSGSTSGAMGSGGASDLGEFFEGIRENPDEPFSKKSLEDIKKGNIPLPPGSATAAGDEPEPEPEPEPKAGARAEKKARRRWERDMRGVEDEVLREEEEREGKERGKKEAKEAKRAAKRAAEIRGEDRGLGTIGSGEFRQPYRLPKFEKAEIDPEARREDLLVERLDWERQDRRDEIGAEQKERIGKFDVQPFRPFTAEAWKMARKAPARRHGNIRQEMAFNRNLSEGSGRGLSGRVLPAFLEAKEEIKRATRSGVIGTQYSAQYAADLEKVYSSYDRYSELGMLGTDIDNDGTVDNVPPPPAGWEIRQNPKVLNDWVNEMTDLTARTDAVSLRAKIRKGDAKQVALQEAVRRDIDENKRDAETMRRDPKAAREVGEHLKSIGY